MSSQPATAGTGHIAGIDVIRVAALMAIVVGHVYTKDELADRLIQSWRLPVFFMLSGYFWSSRRSFRQELHRRSRALLQPYFCWLFLLLSCMVLVDVVKGSEPLGSTVGRALLGGSYATRPLTTFWFFTALFVAVAVHRCLLALPAAFRIAAVTAGLLANVFIGAQLAAVPFSAATACGTLVFLEAGRAVRRLSQTAGARVQACVAAALLIFAAAALALVGDFIPLDIKAGRFPPLAVAVAAALGAAFILTATLMPAMGGPAARILRTVASGSVAIILLHPAVLWVLQPEAGRHPLWAIALAGFLGPLALGLVLARTPFASMLLGVPRTRPQEGPVRAPELRH